MSRTLSKQWLGAVLLALLLSGALSDHARAHAHDACVPLGVSVDMPGLCFIAAHSPNDNKPTNSSGIPRINIYPTPGPGNWIQLNLEHLSSEYAPQESLLVTIQDRLGHVLYQQRYAFNHRILVRFEDTSRILTPGLYSVVVSSDTMFLKEKFVVE